MIFGKNMFVLCASLLVVWLGGCTTTGGAGGVSAVGVAGSACNIAYQNQTCNFVAGAPPQRMQCQGGVWSIVDSCKPSQTCAALADPAAPGTGKMLAQCQDGGQADAAQGNPDAFALDSGALPDAPLLQPDVPLFDVPGPQADLWYADNGSVDAAYVYDAATYKDIPPYGTDYSTSYDTSVKKDVTTVDVPCGGCPIGYVCDPYTSKCTKKPACSSPCKPNETCGEFTGKCVSLCSPACPGTQTCKVVNGSGVCAAPGCAFPQTWGPNLQKFSKIAIADVTKGCDLDGDSKVNNVLGKVVSLYKDANVKLAESVADGTIVLILEAPGYKTDTTPFDINLLTGKFDKNSGCDPTTVTCEYMVSPSSYDISSTAANCPAFVTFPDAKDNGGALTTSGKDVFQLNIPVVGMGLDLKITQASLQGTTTEDAAWKSTKSGLICGVISKDDLNAAIDALPPDVIAQIGDAATVKALVAGILKPDIALTPGGPKDALSVAIEFETIGALVTGLAP